MAASFQYDGSERRVEKTLNGSTTMVLHDGLDAAQETAGATVRNIVTGTTIDEYLSHVSTSGEIRFALSDALGSTIALVDDAGAVVTEYTYEPFGATSSTGLASENHAQYSGRDNDGNGLYYYRTRYYHPTLQRFISEDPIDIVGGDINLYGYVRNNPATFVDPLGLQMQLTDPVFGPPNASECIPRCTTVDEKIGPALEQQSARRPELAANRAPRGNGGAGAERGPPCRGRWRSGRVWHGPGTLGAAVASLLSPWKEDAQCWRSSLSLRRF